MPRLTVILPVRNGAKFIGRAVDSTLRALPRDAKLVVLNDGSTDATKEILESRACSKMDVIESSGCGGLANALNLLIDATDSEYIARMDADDIILPWRFVHQMRVTDADVVYSPVIHLGPNRLAIRPTRPGRLSPDAVSRLLLLENVIAHSTVVFKRNVITSVGGYRQVLSEDYDLWLRLAAQGFKICRTAFPVLLYRHHRDQITMDKDWKSASRVEPFLLEAHESLAREVCGIQGDALSGLRDDSAGEEEVRRSAQMVNLIRGYETELPNRLESRHLREKCDTASRRLMQRLEVAR